MSQPKEVSTTDPLAAFLFDLARDHIPFGVLEKVLHPMEEFGPTRSVFIDEHLGRYVIEMANRIRALEKEEDERDPQLPAD